MGTTVSKIVYYFQENSALLEAFQKIWGGMPHHETIDCSSQKSTKRVKLQVNISYFGSKNDSDLGQNHGPDI